MSEHHTIPDLDRKGLRSFGLTTGAIVAALFGLLIPWLLGRPWPIWPWMIAAPLWLLALAAPSVLKAVYRVWMRFGLLASRITTPLILGILFFVVITPLALARRLGRNDPMRRQFDRAAKTYRIPGDKQPNDRLERPF